jgi:hypothetical protein
MTKYLSPLRAMEKKGEKFTPIIPPMIEALDALKEEYGTWRVVSEVTGVRKRMIYRIRTEEYKCVSMSVLDRILTNSWSALSVEDFPWFTVDELIAVGIYVSEDTHRRMISGKWGYRRYRRRLEQAAHR